jgi:hypothetical protein
VRYEAKKARVEQLYAIADREVILDPGEPEVINGQSATTSKARGQPWVSRPL